MNRSFTWSYTKGRNSKQCRRPTLIDDNKNMFVLASHYRPAAVRDVGAVVLSSYSSCKGLFHKTIGNTRESMQTAVSHLQDLA